MHLPWTVTTLNATVDAEIEALPADMQARLVRISELITAVGLEQVGLPHVKPVQMPLWEIRLSGQSGIARALYLTARDRRVVILRVFVKKTQKTPHSEIRLALERAKLLK
jgi:phage-related protein